jgi:N utilization substance protein B
MQLLYALNRDPKMTKAEVLKQYDDYIENSYGLFLFTLYIFLNTCYESVEDEKKKGAKHLPTEDDQKFTAKLFTNPLVQSLNNNPELEKLFQKYGFSKKMDQDFCKQMYAEYAKLPSYREYVLSSEVSDDDHTEALLELFRVIRKHELFDEIMEDAFLNWQDDKSLAVGAMKKVIKSLPAEGNFFEEYYPDKETAVDFGKSLLREVLDHQDDLLQMVEPTLKNWDIDRLAILDMLLINMALAEFLHFPTIPTKVTLNEYVEISKLYSTPKSKDFVNGILDKLMKTLQEGGKINKEGRGLMN